MVRFIGVFVLIVGIALPVVLFNFSCCYDSDLSPWENLQYMQVYIPSFGLPEGGYWPTSRVIPFRNVAAVGAVLALLGLGMILIPPSRP